MIKSFDTPDMNQPSQKAEDRSSTLIQTKLSKEQKKIFLEKRKKGALWVRIIRYTVIILFFINTIGILFLTIDLSVENGYFKFLNLGDNTAVKYKNSVEKKQNLETRNNEIQAELSKIENQINTKEYSVHTSIIQKLRADQLIWFDKKDESGNITEYGILDSPKHMKDYFTSPDYSQKYGNIILTGNNNITINGISANSNQLNFHVITSNLFGKVFFLSTEFIKMMNSYKFLKDGALTHFSKSKDKNDEDIMDFAISFNIQKPDEIDPYDEYFEEYRKIFSNEKGAPIKQNP